MGMANPSQIAKGIHFRQYSRAFIVADSNNITNRIVFVNIDACMGTQIMKSKVREEAEGGGKYGECQLE